MDIDTTLPTPHRENRPPLQLDALQPDEVMMEVESDLTPTTPSAPKAATSPLPRPTAPQLLAITTNSSTPRTLDTTLHASNQFPLPPVVSIATSDTPPWPKFKLDQLFVEWLALPESTSWITRVLETAKEGKRIDSIPALNTTRFYRPERSLSPSPSRSPTLSQSNRSISPQTPGSPVSRLFSNHIPFGETDSSPKSPPSGSFSNQMLLRSNAISQIVTEVDLGKSGTKSPDGSRTNQRDGHFSTRLQSSNSKTKQDREAKHDGTKKKGNSSSMEITQPVSSQSSDKSSLDKVADGIAGMSAAIDRTDQDGAPHAMKVDVNLKGRESEVESQPRPDGSNRDASPFHPDTNDNKSSQTEMKVDDVKDSAPVSKEKESNSASSSSSLMVLDHNEKSPKTGSAKVSSTKPSLPPRSSYKHPGKTVPITKASRLLPRFYFPRGLDAEDREQREMKQMKEFFEAQQRQKHISGVSRADIAELVVDVIGLPSYFANIVYDAITELFPVDSDIVKRVNDIVRDQNRQSAVAENDDPDMKDVTTDHEDSNSSISRDIANQSSIRKKNSLESDTTMGDVEEEKSNHGQPNGVHHPENAEESVRNAENEDANSAMENQNSPSTFVAGRDYVTEEQFAAYYNTKCVKKSKEERLFLALLEPGASRDYLIPSDFKPLLRALLNCHQGLAFLHATPEFQQRYSETVIERIYFGCTRQHNGRLTLQDIRRSKLLDTLMVVDEEEDINKERKYFSYEHFYVLYCRFWELDANHDLQIDRDDLMRYGSHSLTYRIVDRIFGGYARPLDTPETPGFMSYTDFIWFCLSEEDKTSDTAIDYWFRCVDLDGDGVITMFDMEFFYREQLHRMQCFGHEPVKVRDILCQLLDMINPNVKPPLVRRRDLKRCRLAGNFFNVLFNLNKFFAIEARDPIQIRQEHATPELTDWDRFAALEYLRLSAEDDVEEDESWDDVGEAGNPLMSGEAPF